MALACDVMKLEDVSSSLLTQSTALLARTDDLASTLFLDPFPLLDFLCPLLRDRPTSLIPHQHTVALIKDSLNLMANYSSAKEMMMGLAERLSSLGPRSIDHDDGSDDANEEEGAAEEEEWDGTSALAEAIVLIDLYSISENTCMPSPTCIQLIIRTRTIVLPRIISPRPIKFLNSAIDTIESTLSTLAEQGLFQQHHEGYSEQAVETEKANASVQMIQCVLRFLRSVDSNREWIVDRDSVRRLSLADPANTH